MTAACGAAFSHQCFTFSPSATGLHSIHWLVAPAEPGREKGLGPAGTGAGSLLASLRSVYDATTQPTGASSATRYYAADGSPMATRKPRRSLTSGIDFSTDEGKSLLELADDSSGEEDDARMTDEHSAMRRRSSVDSDNSDSTSDASDRPKRRASADSDVSTKSQPHNPGGAQPQQRRPRRRRSAPDVVVGGSSGSR